MGAIHRLQRRVSALALVLALAFGLLAGGLITLATAGPAAAACSLTPTGGTVTRLINVPGVGWRSYNLRVPSGMSGTVPLLVDHHGFGSFPFGQEVTGGWSQYADQKKFIVAYPAGQWNTWQFVENSIDVTYIKGIVAQIRARYCVDADRVYASGGSFGGLFAQRLACDASDVFASVSAMIAPSLSAVGQPCNLERPVAVALANSENDPIFPLATSAIPNRDQWVARDGCDATPATQPNPYGQYGQVFSGCDGSVQVQFRSYAGNGHGYPTGAALTDFHDKVWTFLLAHPMP